MKKFIQFLEANATDPGSPIWMEKWASKMFWSHLISFRGENALAWAEVDTKKPR